jgi:hypothetical protein
MADIEHRQRLIDANDATRLNMFRERPRDTARARRDIQHQLVAFERQHFDQFLRQRGADTGHRRTPVELSGMRRIMKAGFVLVGVFVIVAMAVGMLAAMIVIMCVSLMTMRMIVTMLVRVVMAVTVGMSELVIRGMRLMAVLAVFVIVLFVYLSVFVFFRHFLFPNLLAFTLLRAFHGFLSCL